MEYDLETKSKILKLKEEGKTTRNIAKELHLSESTLYKWFADNGLKSNGVSKGQRNAIQNEEDKRIIRELYLNGLTIQQIHENFFKDKYNEDNINYYLRLLGITRRNGHKICFDENYFSCINTKEKAYFLGLLCADGCVRQNTKKGKNSWTISIELKLEDRYILEKFKEEIKSRSKVGEYKSENCVRVVNGKTYNFKKHNAYFRVNSPIMANDLINLGCMPNKTYTLKGIPQLEGDVVSHFIRGFYDGDGIASCGKETYMGFCGTESMMNSLKEYLYKTLGINKNSIYYNKSNHIYYLQYTKDDHIKALFSYLYRDAEDYYLTRKKRKIEGYLCEKHLL